MFNRKQGRRTRVGPWGHGPTTFFKVLHYVVSVFLDGKLWDDWDEHSESKRRRVVFRGHVHYIQILLCPFKYSLILVVNLMTPPLLHSVRRPCKRVYGGESKLPFGVGHSVFTYLPPLIVTTLSLFSCFWFPGKKKSFNKKSSFLTYEISCSWGEKISFLQPSFSYNWVFYIQVLFFLSKKQGREKLFSFLQPSVLITEFFTTVFHCSSLHKLWGTL